MEIHKLPKGWKWFSLIDIMNNYDGKRKPISKEIRSKRKGEFRYYGATEIVDYIDDYIFDGEYLLIGEDGANLLSKNKDLAFIVTGKFWVNNHAHVLSSKEITTNKYVCNYFNSLNISQFVTGTAQPKLTQGNLNKINVPIPPLETQQAIVSKIEELFSELDKGIEDLKTAQQQLKIYRQSVLKWAFEGKLTNENVKDGELPEGWKFFKIGEVCKTVDGDRGPNYPKKEEFSKEGYCLYLSTKNVREDRFLFDETIFITKEKDEKLRSGKLQKDDVVITTRGTLGNVALYDDKVPFKHIRINSGMLILRILNENLYNYYLMKFITSPVFINQLKNMQTGTAQPQIPANILREIEILLPPTIKEQHLIVQEIESRLSVADKMEESITQSLQQAEALRQSILKKAFSGELV